ncbi:MAG: hypothetical protein QOK49_2011, partial [Baekduia sp.]|nr:hypothetical protein [Baekduia sp.]
MVDTSTSPDVTGLGEYIARVLGSGARSQGIVAQEVTRVVAEQFGAGALLLLFSPARRSMLTVSADHPDPAVRSRLWDDIDTTADVGESVPLQQTLEGKTVSMRADSPEQLAERVSLSMRPRVIDTAMHSVLSVPLQARGMSYGALCLSRHGAEPIFTADDEARLAALCTRIAPIIDHARVLRALIEDPAQVRTRQAMFEATERFRTVFVHASIGMALFSFENGRPGRLVEVNPRLCEIVALDADELVGRATGSFDHPDNIGGGAEEVAQLLSGALPVATFEKRLVCGDGREIIAHQQITVVRLPDGSTPYGITLLEDVTDQRRIETELVRSEALTRGILDAALDAIVTIDRLGVVV